MVQSLRVIQTQQEERERGNVKMSTLQQRRLEQLEEALLAAQGQCQVAYWPGNLIAVAEDTRSSVVVRPMPVGQ